LIHLVVVIVACGLRGRRLSCGLFKIQAKISVDSAPGRFIMILIR